MSVMPLQQNSSAYMSSVGLGYLDR